MIIPMEKIYKRYENKYRAINVASLEARRIKDEQTKGLLEQQINPVFEAVRKLIAGKIKYIEQ